MNDRSDHRYNSVVRFKLWISGKSYVGSDGGVAQWSDGVVWTEERWNVGCDESDCGERKNEVNSKKEIPEPLRVEE